MGAFVSRFEEKEDLRGGTARKVFWAALGCHASLQFLRGNSQISETGEIVVAQQWTIQSL